MLINWLSRDVSLKIHYILDQWVPPILRDQWWFMAIPLRMVFGRHAPVYRDFKARAHAMTEAEFRSIYEEVGDTSMARETDLNVASIAAIQEHIQGKKILDVGCGRGYMTRILSQNYEVTGVDIIIPEAMKSAQPQVTFIEAPIEHLPFDDHSFDTVVCSHTLEHVLNLPKAIAELRRVCKHLVIVVPRQRPYKYTFDLHINFFPYLHTVPALMGTSGRTDIICRDVDGDILYVEQVVNP